RGADHGGEAPVNLCLDPSDTVPVHQKARWLSIKASYKARDCKKKADGGRDKDGGCRPRDPVPRDEQQKTGKTTAQANYLLGGDSAWTIGGHKRLSKDRHAPTQRCLS